MTASLEFEMGGCMELELNRSSDWLGEIGTGVLYPSNARSRTTATVRWVARP